MYLNDFIIRFEYAESVQILKFYDMILTNDRDTSQLFPGAPNREAVEYNFNNAIKGFQTEFNQFDSRLKRSKKLTSFQDLLQRNVNHVYNPEFVYTNGQQIITVQKHADTYELALHRSYSAFIDFFSEYNQSLSLESLEDFDKLSDLELIVRRNLSRLELTMLNVFKKQSHKVGFLQQVRHLPSYTHYLHFKGQIIPITINRENEAYTVLNSLPELIEGYQIKACASCKHFAFSGLSRDMSEGSMGYCQLKFKMNEKTGVKQSSPEAIVSVFDECDKYQNQ